MDQTRSSFQPAIGGMVIRQTNAADALNQQTNYPDQPQREQSDLHPTR
jgi:hypothetical protein